MWKRATQNKKNALALHFFHIGVLREDAQAGKRWKVEREKEDEWGGTKVKCDMGGKKSRQSKEETEGHEVMQIKVWETVRNEKMRICKLENEWKVKKNTQKSKKREEQNGKEKFGALEGMNCSLPPPSSIFLIWGVRFDVVVCWPFSPSPLLHLSPPFLSAPHPPPPSLSLPSLWYGLGSWCGHVLEDSHGWFP